METVNLDLGLMLASYIEKQLAEYEEPHSKREGRPFTATFKASMLALTSMSIREQAESLGLDPDGLKTSRTKQRFKNLVKQHMAAFTGEVLVKILADTISRYKGLMEYACGDDGTYQEADISINVGPLSWDAYRQIVEVVLLHAIDTERLRQICGGVLGAREKPVNDFNLFIVASQMFALYAEPLLEGARRFYGRSRKEIREWKALALASHRHLCCEAIVGMAREPDGDSENCTETAKKCIELLMKVHGISSPDQLMPTKTE